MPDNKIIEELLKGVNKAFEKQMGSYESLMTRFEEAEKNGSTKEFISLLSKEIGRMGDSINKQKDIMTDVYNEVSNRARKRGENIDTNVIKDIYAFIRELAEKRHQINKLKEEYNTKGKYTREEKKDISRRIKELEDNIKQTRKEKQEEYNKTYQKGSAEATSLRILTTDEKIRGVADDINTIQKGQVANVREIAKAQDVNNNQLQQARQLWGIIKDSARATWTQVKNGGNLWLKYNAQAISDAKRLGMTSKEEAMGYMETLMENSKTLARNFGMTAEQAMKMQDAYVKVTGRAAMLTESQMEDIAAASKLMGEETVQSAIGIMNSMGTTSQTTTELLDRNFARAVNSGLDTVKASEAFVKNMSLANKLNFRNGVDGISRMTILSEKIKMNLQEVSAVADKFSTIEGAIEGAARLQMLGGTGALYGSNPMQMMYEALSDPESLFERMGKMFSQQAVFDRRTGEARIDPVQMQIMREQAKAIGMNPDEAIQSAKQQAKLNAIESDFRGYNPSLFNAATEEQKAAIANKAEYNKEKGTWEIKYINSTGEEKVADIQNITNEQLLEITKDNIEPVEDIRTNVRKIAGELIGTQERMDSMKDQWKTGISQLIHGPMKAFDSILTGLNNSGFWKIITAGGIGTLAGLGGFLGLNLAVGLGKYKIGKWATNKILQRIAGQGASSTISAASGGGSAGIQGTRDVSGALNTSRAGSNFARGRRIVQAKNALNSVRAGLKASGRVAVPLAIATEIGLAAWDYHQAGQERKAEEQRILQREQSVNVLTGRRRFTENDIEQQRIKADNAESEAKGKAIGAGSGALAGMAIGAVVGGPIGAAIGAALGGIVGSFVGGKVAPEKQGDIIAEHLKEIERGDEEDNFKKIVLPVESIDYNVSLIANQLGILSATPARGNIYLEAEAAGEVMAEGVPLQASTVNQVDTHVINSSQIYQPSGPLKLNVNGAIDLKLNGTNIGKLTEQIVMKMLQRPDMQRQLAENVVKEVYRNGNGSKYTSDNSRLNRNTFYGTGTSGTGT